MEGNNVECWVPSLVYSGFTLVNWALSSLIVDWTADISQRLQSNICPMLMTSFSEIDGVEVTSRALA